MSMAAIIQLPAIRLFAPPHWLSFLHIHLHILQLGWPGHANCDATSNKPSSDKGHTVTERAIAHMLQPLKKQIRIGMRICQLPQLNN